MTAPARPGIRSGEIDAGAVYRDYLARALDRARQVRDLHREILDHIADGTLAPAALDARLSAFAQTDGPGYARALTDASIQFLTDMVDLAPAAADGAASRNGEAAHVVRTLMETVTGGPVPGTSADAEVPDGIAHLVGLYFDLLTKLEDIHARYEQRCLDAVLNPVRDALEPVRVSGAPGSSGTLRLEVANAETTPQSVRCTIADVRRADGVGPAFQPHATIRPETFELAPGEDRNVLLSLPLASTSYEPGHAYVATLRVTTATGTLLEVPLRIDVEPPEPSPA